MEPEIINSYSKLSGLNVSRETFLDFENYISMILEKNEKINLISDKFSKKNDIIAVSYTHLTLPTTVFV